MNLGGLAYGPLEAYIVFMVFIFTAFVSFKASASYFYRPNFSLFLSSSRLLNKSASFDLFSALLVESYLDAMVSFVVCGVMQGYWTSLLHRERPLVTCLVGANFFCRVSFDIAVVVWLAPVIMLLGLWALPIISLFWWRVLFLSNSALTSDRIFSSPYSSKSISILSKLSMPEAMAGFRTWLGT